MADPTIRHQFRNYRTDDVDATLVRPAEWEQDHTFTMATARLLGRTTAGAGVLEELAVSPAGQLAAGVLTLIPGLSLLAYDTFTANGTWNKHADALLVLVYCVGGGAGGNSGYIENTTGIRTGGVGGGAGQVISAILPAGMLSASESITVGTGGGGAAGSTTTTPNRGTDGSPSSFGSRLLAYGGSSDYWQGVAGLPGFGLTYDGDPPYSSYTQPFTFEDQPYYPGWGMDYSGGRGGCLWQPIGPGGGGGGGGFSSSTPTNGLPGGAGSSNARTGTQQILSLPTPSNSYFFGGGGAAGSATTNGGTGSSRTFPEMGDGGGGGGGGISAGVGNGGNGGTPGGGGGGGGTKKTGTSGAGGSGARGEIHVWQFGSTAP